MREIIPLWTVAAALLCCPSVQAADGKSAQTGHHKMSLSEHMKIMNKQMMDMLGKGDEQYDLRFIDLMIEHHQGGVEMAEDALKKARHPEIKQLSKEIIRAQNKEIEQMRKWRKEWYQK